MENAIVFTNRQVDSSEKIVYQSSYQGKIVFRIEQKIGICIYFRQGLYCSENLQGGWISRIMVESRIIQCFVTEKCHHIVIILLID